MDHLLSEVLENNFKAVSKHDAVIMDDKFLTTHDSAGQMGAATLLEQHAKRIKVDLVFSMDFPDRVIFGI